MSDSPTSQRVAAAELKSTRQRIRGQLQALLYDYFGGCAPPTGPSVTEAGVNLVMVADEIVALLVPPLAAARRTAFDRAKAAVRSVGMDPKTNGYTIQRCVEAIHRAAREER